MLVLLIFKFSFGKKLFLQEIKVILVHLEQNFLTQN